MSRLWLSVAAAAALSSAGIAAYAADLPAYVTAALADPGRAQADRDADALRKPGNMVEFAGIKPGMKVVDISPGGPYYFTRVFSKVVGPNGVVYAVDNPPRPRPAGAPPAGGPPPGAPPAAGGMAPGGGRGAGGPPPGGAPGAAPVVRAPISDYANVKLIAAPIVQGFTLPEKVDVMWTSRNYHDFKNANPDLSAFNKAVFDGLKPGGIFVVLDHAAKEDDTPDVTSRLHRIQSLRVKAEVVAAGFKFVGQDDELRNPQDDDTKRVFEAGEHDHTDQFILKFQKPN